MTAVSSPAERFLLLPSREGEIGRDGDGEMGFTPKMGYRDGEMGFEMGLPCGT